MNADATRALKVTYHTCSAIASPWGYLYELEHARSEQHIAYLDVVNRHNKTKSMIYSIQSPYQAL